MKNYRNLHLHNISYTNSSRVHRIQISVNDEDLWYESSDAELLPKVEGFLSALLLPAMTHGLDISVDYPVNPTWLHNAEILMRIYQDWWGLTPVRIQARGQTEPLQFSPGNKTALFFSGGVDSFYNLVNEHCPVDYLVFVHLYDRSIQSENKLSKLVDWHRHSAEAFNKKYVLIRTNLREHSAYTEVNWEKSHGGALAAAGHFLNSCCGRIIISSSFPYVYTKPWGTHWETDPLWSDGNIEILHIGAEYWRTEKLNRICENTIIQKHLRVCFNIHSDQLNCCACEKCVRTMLILAQQGVLHQFTSFATELPLHETVENLGSIRKHLVPVYRAFLKGRLDKSVKQQIKILIKNSTRKSSSGNVLVDLRKRITRKLPAPVIRICKMLLRRGNS
jgi:hypothetical protein